VGEVGFRWTRDLVVGELDPIHALCRRPFPVHVGPIWTSLIAPTRNDCAFIIETGARVVTTTPLLSEAASGRSKIGPLLRVESGLGLARLGARARRGFLLLSGVNGLASINPGVSKMLDDD